jgi:hypothetical protein
MEFLHYGCVLAELAEKVIAAHQTHRESDEAEGLSTWFRLRLGRCKCERKKLQRPSARR